MFWVLSLSHQISRGLEGQQWLHVPSLSPFPSHSHSHLMFCFMVFALALYGVRWENCGCPYCCLGLSWWHTCISCSATTGQLARKGTACAGRRKGLSHKIRDFEVRNFVKSYPLDTRCVVFDNDLFIRFEERTVLFKSFHWKLNWIHKGWNFSKGLDKWFFSLSSSPFCHLCRILSSK